MDLIMCYKILYGLVDINSARFSSALCMNLLEKNSLKLAKLHVISERDKNILTNRVINIWNALPDSIVTSSSVSNFKRNIAQFDFSRYLLFY